MRSSRFVAREHELELLLQVLAGDRACVFVHGQGGIGKSALLAELLRRARAQGVAVEWLDGREPLVGEAVLHAGRLIIVDAYEEAPALGPPLRAALAAGTRMVVASRQPPEPAWSEIGVEELVLEVPLGPMTEADARRLLEARGVPADRAATLAGWGAGHPLSLAVAADLTLADATLDVGGLDTDQLLASTLVRRLARDELDGADHRVLAVAAVARAVDARLLAAVVPELDGDRAETWLRSLSFSEPLGSRVTLHARMRAALATALAAQDPIEDRDLRRRIADHAYARIVLGEQRLFADLTEMIADPRLRWGLAPPQMNHRVTPARPGDRDRVAALLGVTTEAWWRDTARWFDEAPDRVAICRDASGDISGWGIFLTPATAPEWADDDPIVGRWLADARRAQPDGDTMMLRDGGELPVPDPVPAVSEAIAAGNLHIFLEVQLPTIRRTYAPVRKGDEATREFLLAAGYQPAPELDIDEGGRSISTYVADWGPGGLFRATRDLVYMSLGLTPPAPVNAGDPDSLAQTVRDALRSFHDPRALASSPLARGVTVEERSASVREQLRAATDAAFDETPDGRLLRETIVRGYLDPEIGHSAAMHQLYVSRATYYRRLAQAAGCIAVYLS